MDFDTHGLFDEDYTYFYEPLLTDERSDAETELITRLLSAGPGTDVLDLACGHGRIANRLAAYGCHVTGLDVTPYFLDLARQGAAERGVAVEYVHADMRKLPWDQPRFDAVVSWFTSFGYFDDAGNRQVLTEVRRVLRSGGRFLMELQNRDRLARELQPAIVTERNGDLMIDRNRLDPLTSRIVTDRVVVRSGRVRRIPYFVRLFTFTELRDWLSAAGFSTVEAYDEKGDSFSAESRRLLAVANVS